MNRTEQGNKKKRSSTLMTVYIVRVAFLAALITVAKLALSFVPNVEVVTLLLIVYGAALGIAYALPSALIFCAVEVAIYGVGSWVLLYFIYWPLLALVASLLLKGKRLWLAVIIAVFMSALFGVLSACTDTIVIAASLSAADMGAYFVGYYLRGLYFDVVHMVSSLVTVLALYLPLVSVLKRVAKDAYLANVTGSRKLIRFPDEYKREQK